MKKQFNFDDRTVIIADVSVVFEATEMNGISVHDSTDVNHNGDCIFFDVSTADFDTAEELQTFFDNETPITDWETLNSVKMLDNSQAARQIIANARISQGMTQAELARKMGVPVSWIGKLEAGTIKIENATFSKGWKLCTILNINPDILLS